MTSEQSNPTPTPPHNPSRHFADTTAKANGVLTKKSGKKYLRFSTVLVSTVYSKVLFLNSKSLKKVESTTSSWKKGLSLPGEGEDVRR